ncbi:T9SS type A sorting domain-containing protein [Pedobacter glucosidilyticus]|uniref:T9SS type A sorting domain-containing protein n=1 Tax=Pedobacter glucosidilyticus TaxID=1122941 RepID=UPI00041A601F|nr:T9SS type A sorting domain-containing protein [Pedobacter glucosidilyticus]
MTNIKHIIKRRILIIGLVIFSSILGLKAQSNLTKALGITEADFLASPASPAGFGTVRNRLTPHQGNCFIITADFNAQDFSDFNSESKVFSFRLRTSLLSEILIFEILVKNIGGKKRWYIRRPLEVAGANMGKNFNLDYEIYEDLGLDGKFTFIFGHHFTAIAVDANDTLNYKMAPVFFGMDSNLGSFNSHMGEFTGETGIYYGREVYLKKKSRVYKMPGDAKIATLINALKPSITNNNIINAIKPKGTNDVVLISDLTETSQASNLQLYPNPSDGKFNVDFSLKEGGPVSFKIYDLKGQKVYEQNDIRFVKGKHTYTIDVSSKLPAGVYILKVSSAEINQSVKMIVQ